MSQVAIFTYQGLTPGADANVYSLYDSVQLFPGAGMASQMGMKRLQIDLAHNQAGTLKWYKPTTSRGLTSTNNGTGTAATTLWTQIGTLAVAAPAAGVSDSFDFLVEEFYDFKLEWTNGGVAQNPWIPSIALSDERVKGT